MPSGVILMNGLFPINNEYFNKILSTKGKARKLIRMSPKVRLRTHIKFN